MSDALHFRWLGTAGIELEYRGERILIDPYLSRFPIWNTILGRPVPNRDLVTRHLSPARAVLVSHAHFDHLADVPNICREFGAVAYGSANASAILRAHGLPAEQAKTVRVGDAFRVGPFDIRILPGRHGRMLGMLPFTGRLPARLQPPLRLSDYRMDEIFSFLVKAAGRSVLFWNGPESEDIPRADVLFYCPLWGVRECAAVAQAAKASAVIPVHWDDFFCPLDGAYRPLVVPPGWSSPWIRRMEPNVFARSVEKLLPGTRVFIPEILQSIALELAAVSA
ncbi:MAG: MBL fold metallo-hydrolase [Anaerolineales bacterium]|nr:MBL fold metallo-hydrolase [Anaerolineales bacterium]